MKYLPHYTLVLSTLLLVGVVFGVQSVQADGPVFSDAQIYTLKFSTYPTTPRKSSFKDGDATYLTAIIDNQATTTEVYADLSPLGGSAHAVLADVYDYYAGGPGTNLIRQFQGDFFTIQASSTTATIPITITAIDENGSTSETTLSVSVDNTVPVFSVSSVVAATSTPLQQLSELSFSGTSGGTGSALTVLDIYEQEIGVDGETVLYQSVYDKNSAAAPGLFVLADGAFTDVPLTLYTATGADQLPSDVYFIKFLFHVRDQADNKVTASSALITVATPPVASIDSATTTESVATTTDSGTATTTSSDVGDPVATTTVDVATSTSETTEEATTTPVVEETTDTTSSSGSVSHASSHHASTRTESTIADEAPITITSAVTLPAIAATVVSPVARTQTVVTTPGEPRVVAIAAPTTYEREPVSLSPTVVTKDAPILRPNNASPQTQTASVYDALNPDFIALLEALERFFAQQSQGILLVMLAGGVAACAGIGFSTYALLRPRTLIS